MGGYCVFLRADTLVCRTSCACFAPLLCAGHCDFPATECFCTSTSTSTAGASSLDSCKVPLCRRFPCLQVLPAYGCGVCSFPAVTSSECIMRPTCGSRWMGTTLQPLFNAFLPLSTKGSTITLLPITRVMITTRHAHQTAHRPMCPASTQPVATQPCSSKKCA